MNRPAPSFAELAPLRWRVRRFTVVVGALYAGYQILNRWHLRPPVFLPLTGLDHAIPLLAWTVWPYLILAGCVGLLLAVRSRALFERALKALLIAYPIDLLIFALFPTTYPRVAVVPGTGLNQAAFNYLFTIDTPANCFPSGHITAPLIAFWALALENPRWRVVLWLTFAALAPTILTTKQHYVVDLVGGLGTAVLGIWLSGKRATKLGAPAGGSWRDIPGPRFNLGIVNLFAFWRNPLRFLEQMNAQCGAVARCRLAWQTRFLVNDPALAAAVFDLPHTASNKRTWSVAMIRRICGESVLTANGESWFRRRRIVQPAFHRQQVARHVDTMTTLTRAMIADWREVAGAGGALEINAEMRRLTFRFVCKGLFNADPSERITALEVSIDNVLAETWRSIRSPLDWGARRRSGRKRRVRESMAVIDEFVAQMIAVRRAVQGEPRDLLSMLLEARDADTGAGMTDLDVRNEIVTLLIAGFDTTANALAWALLELSRNGLVRDELQRESLAVLDGGRSPTLADVPRLRFARAVFLETLRLHPPIWIMERNLETAVSANGWWLPSGAQVLISPWILHRLPQYWERADQFIPARFEQGAISNQEENPAFVPFGFGPRTCVGRQLAMLEGQVFLALIARAGELRPEENAAAEDDAGITLRPRGGTRLRFAPTAVHPVPA